MSQIADRRSATRTLRSRFDTLEDRELILFGGKGGVGKTTLSLLAATHFSERRPVTLVTTDPAGNLDDFSGDAPGGLSIETIDAPALWREFLDENLESFLELGDRGTYLDREELRRFFELSIPGVDELMGWSRIAELVTEADGALVIVDTAPTGHTLRLLASSKHWHAMALVLESMQAKYREIVSHLTRTDSRDALDEFLEGFESVIKASEKLFADPARSAFIPVAIAEPWVVDQTVRLISEVREAELNTPFTVLNHASISCDCGRCEGRRGAEAAAEREIPTEVVTAPRACALFRSFDDLRTYLDGKQISGSRKESSKRIGNDRSLSDVDGRLSFVVGKGGVGKTTVATALSLSAAGKGQKVTLLSVDPAHSVSDVFNRIEAPANLRVETIDTKASWKKLEAEVGRAVSKAVSGLTPKGFQNVHDEAITKQLLEISPPGADEIFALIRILELWDDDSIDRIVVDTAPTGHFLRILELPEVAGEWVRELMRIMLRYREILSSTSFGEKLLNASKSLRRFDETLKDPECSAVLVTRPEPIVISESLRLLSGMEEKGLRLAAIVANALTPESDCACDERVRNDEAAELDRFGDRELIVIERRDEPPVTEEELLEL
ncbi:MAG: TRC40/GET3/ArsA family transport-energizing ATPase [Acidobacteria bacterium]|nr:TRC40/GET3/ArsA family transport-energizing ATPase [Acidobacteriota bacterium]